MVTVNGQAVVIAKFSNQTIERLKAKITDSSVSRELTSLVRPLVQQHLKDALAGTNNNSEIAIKLNPTKQPDSQDIIGRLGVADPRIKGVPDLDKLNNAWKQLIPIGSEAASFSISVKPGNIKNFVTIKYTIDKNKFYESKQCTFIYYKQNEPIRINWMRDYIEGAVVEGYGFSGPQSNSFKRIQNSGRLNQISRTGYGFLIKIPSGAFRIQPLGFDPFLAAKKVVKDTITSDKFKESFRRAFLRALGKV